MGYRLDGQPIELPTRGELLSCPMPLGGIQITPGGQPILLMADHATTGGYPVLAVVMTCDVPLAGQLAPGDWVEFALGDLEAAVNALRARARVFGDH
jgi:antagonist of KipI